MLVGPKGSSDQDIETNLGLWMYFLIIMKLHLVKYATFTDI